MSLKKILVVVETDLTDKQIEAHGATLYLMEGSGAPECCPAERVEVIKDPECRKCDVKRSEHKGRRHRFVAKA